MNCHSQIFSNSPFLEPVRESFRTDRSIQWTRVHDLPDFVYFNHSIHVNKGVGCTTCHGQVDRMPLMWQEQVAADGVVPRLPSATPSSTCGRARPCSASTTRRRPISSSSDAGWSPSTRFRSSRAARRAIDERRDSRIRDSAFGIRDSLERLATRGAIQVRPAPSMTRGRRIPNPNPAVVAHARRAGRRSGVPRASVQRVPVARSKRSPIRSRAGRS